MESVLEKEFNLLFEPWIVVRTIDGLRKEVSLLEIFENAQEYQSLSGEMPTQDVALLRLLLAILHGALGGKEIDGTPFPDNTEDQIDCTFELWGELWRYGLPYDRIRTYLTEFEDRFYLFHPATPFYQVAGLNVGTRNSVAKLIGEIGESNNKTRLFPQRAANGKSRLSFAEAARWLPNLNGFDDTASKPTNKGLPSPGAGWLGKLGLIVAVGENLHQTFLLNLVLLPDGTDSTWGNDRPIWEIPPRTKERVQIPPPNSQAALLTLQSRRLLLERDGEAVVGYILQGGDFFSKENRFEEQMTVWRNTAKNEGSPPEYTPKRHNPAVQLWRDFSPLVEQGERKKRPGVISWLKRLSDEQKIETQTFQFQVTGLSYGDKDFFVDGVISDTLCFNASLLSELHSGWITRIIAELNVTEKLVWEVGSLAQGIAKASGIKDGKAGKGDGAAARDEAKTQAYYELDSHFRRWLESIDPSTHIISDKCDEWWDTAKSVVRALGRDMMNNCSPQALIGRSSQSATEYYNWFLYFTKNRESLNMRGVKKDGK